MAKSDLRVGISADSSKFDKAMSDVRSNLSKTKQDTKKNTDDVAKDYDALSDKLKSALDNISGGMLSQFKEGYDIAKNIVNVMGSFKTVELFKGGFEGLKESFSGVFDGLGTNLAKTTTQTAAVSAATSTMTQNLTSAGIAATTAGQGIKGFSDSLSMVDNIRNAQTHIEELKQSYANLEYSLTYVSGMLDEIARTGVDSLNGFTADELKAEYDELTNRMKDVSEEISSTDTNLKNLGTTGKSISEKLEGVGKSMVDSFKGLGNAILHPIDTFKNLKSGIISGFKSALTAIKGFSVKSAAYIAVATGGISLLVTAIAGVVASLGAFFTRTEDGQRRMQRFIATVKGAFEGVGDALSAIGRQVADSPITGFFSKIVGFIGTIVKGLGTIGNLITKWITGVDVYASIEESAKKALKIEEERQKMQTWWEGSVDGTTKSMRLQVNEAKTQVEALREQAAATTDFAKKQELINQMLEKQKWINEQNKKYRDWELEIAQATFDANDSNADAQKEFNDLKERLYNEEQADLKAITRIQRQLNGSVETGVEKLKEANGEIKKIQAWADKLGISVKVTEDNVSQLAKELELITSSNGLVDISLGWDENMKTKLLKVQEQFEKYPLKLPVEAEEKTEDTLVQDLQEKLDKMSNAQKLKLGINPDIIVDDDNFGELYKKVGDFQEDFASELNDILETNVANSISSLMESLGEAFTSGNFMDVASTLLENLATLLKQFGSALIAYGVALDAFKQAFANPWAAIAAGAALAVAGGVLGAVANKLKATDFADGGIVYGETYARVAEYSGARNNPEVIAPLDRLKSILSDTNDTIGGEVKFRVSGSELVGVLNNHNRRVGKFG